MGLNFGKSLCLLGISFCRQDISLKLKQKLHKHSHYFLTLVAVCIAEDDKAEKTEAEMPKVDEDVGKSRDGSKTDDEAVEREEEAIKLDGLNVAQMKEIRDKAEKFAFQAEVSRMMKLIINSLYRNKEVRSAAIIQ